jgi:ATP-dependent DNA helicase recQ
LRLLTAAGYIEFVDEITTRSRVMVVMNRRDFYDLHLDTDTDRVLQLILRTYTGLWADYVYISEDLIASRLHLSQQKVYEALLALGREHVLHYVPRKTTPYIIFTTSRELPKHVMIPKTVYEDMRTRMEKRIDSMKAFIFDDSHCRVTTMLSYFGEKTTDCCHTCDVCRSQRKRPGQRSRKEIEAEIIRIASQPGHRTVQYIAEQLSMRPEAIIPLVRDLLDSGTLTADGLQLSVPR